MSRHKNLVIKYCDESVFAWWHYVEVDCMLTFRTFSMSPLARSPRRCRQQGSLKCQYPFHLYLLSPPIYMIISSVTARNQILSCSSFTNMSVPLSKINLGREFITQCNTETKWKTLKI